MAAALGEALVLGSPVARIVSDQRTVVLVESSRLKVSARRVVVAMMPADTRRIEFIPDLPSGAADWSKGWRGQPAVKVNAIYERPFWRDDGLSGLGVSDKGPIGITFDNSPHDGSRGAGGVPDGRRTPQRPGCSQAPGARRAGEALRQPAKSPVAYFETDWSSDGWTSGCVSPLPPNILTRFGSALRTPVGRIHWAGTETSDIWCGYMDGAVRSGERVAAEVLAAFDRGD